MNNITIKELINLREEEIMEHDLTLNVFKSLNFYWQKFNQFSNSMNVNYFSKELANQYLIKAKSELSMERYKKAYKAICVLEDFNYLFSTKTHFKNSEILLTPSYQNLFDSYIKRCEENFNSLSTLRSKKSIIKIIFNYFKLNNINELKSLNKSVINGYIESLLDKPLNTKITNYWVLKDFLKFLYETNIIKEDFSILIPQIKNRKNKTVLTTWTKEEIDKILMAIPNEKPIDKRNYLIILLAVRLGLRIIDIKNLKLDNINWEKETIEIIQIKTKNKIVLPLTQEIGWKLIDYIKNDRPNTDSKFLFVKYSFPYESLSIHNDLRNVLILAYKKANINIEGKNGIGVHSLRHTLGSRLLENQTPLNIISSSLGHVNVNSTKYYLKVDIDGLKNCCLEVPSYDK